MREGLFLTAARINGQEVGPFVIDSGASHVVLDASLAARLIGKLPVNQPGRTNVVTVAVGPLALEDIPVAVRDLSAASTSLGQPLAGLLGFPLFARTVVVVNYGQGMVACFDPRTYQLPWGEWLPLSFQANRPVLTARLEGPRVGQFLLDTGSNHTALLYPDFVRTQGLQATHWTTRRLAISVDGSHDTDIARLAWFELAGIRFDRPFVAFARPDQAGPPGIAGIIGAGFLQRFMIVFNYPASKIAFLPQTPAR